MAREINKRRGKAYHEAGHAVVAYQMGGWVDSLDIAGRGCANFSVATVDDTTERVSVIYCAGWLAEWRWHRQGSRFRRRECLKFIIEATRGEIDEERAGDVQSSILRLIRDCDATDEELIARFRDYENEAARLIDTPAIWNQIKRLVPPLIQHGKLTQEQVEEILSG
jgi:hypothetical protein